MKKYELIEVVSDDYMNRFCSSNYHKLQEFDSWKEAKNYIDVYYQDHDGFQKPKGSETYYFTKRKEHTEETIYFVRPNSYRDIGEYWSIFNDE